MTLRQVSEVYGIPERTLRDLIAREQLSAVRFPEGRKFWLRRADVDRLISNSVTAHQSYKGA